MQIELTDEELRMMTYALGIATGALHQLANFNAARKVVALVNKINKDVPDWRPYEI